MMLIDAQQRTQATDPCSSFIVQAPAGSGKTEILTQRFLRLLSTVSAPEQIIALTFTRKAASEMRERIVLALQQAANNNPAKSAHQQKTLEYAQQALKQSEKYQWDLLQQANRLKICTIDSLCQSINQSIPLLEKQIDYAQISDKPNRHLNNAARNCMQHAMEATQYQHAIKTLLLHVDNQQERLLKLFKDLLVQRDQWLPSLYVARDSDKAYMEKALRVIEEHALQRLQNSLPSALMQKLMQLASKVALIENNPESVRYQLRDPGEINQARAYALTKLLLTTDGNYRKAFDHHVGVKRAHCTDEEFQSIKKDSQQLLAQLAEYPDFLDALVQVSQLPNPQYDPDQWQVLQALFLLLPLLVAHLHLCFSEHNEVDFTTVSQQALTALGNEEAPTDLALYLDNTICHLLVDEFQDTSITQFELISKLVQGWQSSDGKTLFLVGDPMQSIYRFRQAEVGLFFRAKEQGIGPITLSFLELRCNFRSTASIVNWVNSQFSKIFPKQIDIESGAVSFHPSTHVLEADDTSAVHAFSFNTKELEAHHLIEILQHELQQYPKQTIAVLVRSRSQLTEIIRALRTHQIPYQGTDIDLLANLEHVRDVWSLTQALLNPANRLSWLSLLRSPFCGLNLEDLHKVALFNPKKSIYASLLALDSITDLSEDGRCRANYFIQVMHKSLSQRYQNHLSNWVADTLKQLHAEQILTQKQQDDLEQFWMLLDRFEQQGRLQNNTEFMEELSNLYSQQATPSRLQVMTIHKSKGLEFDTVLLPGLNKQPRAEDNPLLRWLKLPTQSHGDLLLVSPIRAAHQEHCALYEYMSRIDAEKSTYETQRLLYVAATRAKSRLYLLSNSNKTPKGSFKSLLKLQEFEEVVEEECIDKTTTSLPIVKRLPLAFYQQKPNQASEFINEPPTALASSIPRLTGIVAHQLLQWICDNHPTSQQNIPWNLALYEFKKLGFDEIQQQTALSTLQQQIDKLYHDRVGLWIIQQHTQEQNEYELLVEHNNNVVTRIIDRTFIDQGILWIIDFKTGKEDQQSMHKHQQQLNEYAQHLYKRTELPIQCGLFYLANTHWVQWHYEYA